MRGSLKENLDLLELPKEAVTWLMMMFDAIQTFDDYADGDSVSRSDLDTLIWNTLLEMPMNPFYVKNCSMLYPMIATCILKWKASDTIERHGVPCAMSFAWRAGFYDLVLLVYTLCHGHEMAKKNGHVIMSLYGEKFGEYIEEMSRCQVQE